MMDFVGKKQWFFLASIILVVVGIISLAVFGIKPGTDFAGGTSITLEFSPAVEQSQLREEMARLGYDKATIQNAAPGSP